MNIQYAREIPNLYRDVFTHVGNATFKKEYVSVDATPQIKLRKQWYLSVTLETLSDRDLARQDKIWARLLLTTSY